MENTRRKMRPSFMHEESIIKETKDKKGADSWFPGACSSSCSNTWQWGPCSQHHGDRDATREHSPEPSHHCCVHQQTALGLLRSLGNLDSFFKIFVTLYCFLYFGVYLKVFHSKVFLNPWHTRGVEASLELFQR